jgi:hypothetical protein
MVIRGDGKENIRTSIFKKLEVKREKDVFEALKIDEFFSQE